MLFALAIASHSHPAPTPSFSGVASAVVSSNSNNDNKALCFVNACHASSEAQRRKSCFRLFQVSGYECGATPKLEIRAWGSTAIASQAFANVLTLTLRFAKFVKTSLARTSVVLELSEPSQAFFETICTDREKSALFRL